MKYNRKQLRERCGNPGNPIPAGTLKSAVSRGHLVVDEDGLIDDENPINKEWIEKKLNEAEKGKQVNKVKFNAKKAELETEKLEEELRVARIKRQKMEGELIPTSLVKNMFQTHFKNFKRTFTAASEQISTDLVKKLGGDINDQAKAKEMLVLTVNSAADQGLEMSKADIRMLVEEYSENGKGST